MFEKADKILSKVINQKGLGKSVLSAQICLEAEKYLAQEFPKLKSQVTAQSFSQGILKISSKNAMINQEIQFKKHPIIKKINQKFGSDLIKDLRFIVRSN